jgi:hypothetical protein
MRTPTRSEFELQAKYREWNDFPTSPDDPFKELPGRADIAELPGKRVPDRPRWPVPDPDPCEPSESPEAPDEPESNPAT